MDTVHLSEPRASGEDGAGSPSPYCFASSTETLRKKDVKIEYVVDGLIPKGFITLLYAPSGLGKSTLATQICQAVQDGVPFLGLKTQQGPAFYIDYENPQSTIVERLKKIDGENSFQLWHLGDETTPPQLDNVENRDMLLGLQPGTLVVIDSLKACNNLDENVASSMKPLFDFLKILRERGLTIILLHHTSKSANLAFRGSSLIQDQSDHCISLIKIKSKGIDTEVKDYGEKVLYKFGVKDKTRAKPFEMTIAFDTAMGLFVTTESLKDSKLEIIAKAISNLANRGLVPNQSMIIDEVANMKDESMGSGMVRDLLVEGEGRFWTAERGAYNAKIFRVLP